MTHTTVTVDRAAGKTLATFDLDAGDSAAVTFPGPRLERFELVSPPADVWVAAEGTSLTRDDSNVYALTRPCTDRHCALSGDRVDTTVHLLAIAAATVSIKAL